MLNVEKLAQKCEYPNLKESVTDNIRKVPVLGTDHIVRRFRSLHE
jgi:hypothetical protein